jgi:5-(carboxyamino)imidazole ribonucleotide mutase
VATFAVGSAGARNAAYFAAQIVASDKPAVASALAASRWAAADKVERAEAEVRAELEESGD